MSRSGLNHADIIFWGGCSHVCTQNMFTCYGHNTYRVISGPHVRRDLGRGVWGPNLPQRTQGWLRGALAPSQDLTYFLYDLTSWFKYSVTLVA